MDNMCPRRRSDLKARVVEGETVVWDRRGKRIHQLNETASYIWDRCDGRHTVGEIAGKLAEDFAVDLHTAEKDVAAAVWQFVDACLLELPSGSEVSMPGRP